MMLNGQLLFLQVVNTADIIFSDVTFGCTTPIENSSPVLHKTDMTKHKSLERSASNQSGSSGGTPHYSPASKDSASPIAPPQTPPTVSRSPSVSPGTSSSNLTTGVPLAERLVPDHLYYNYHVYQFILAYLSLCVRKPTIWVSDQVRHIWGCTVTEVG